MASFRACSTVLVACVGFAVSEDAFLRPRWSVNNTTEADHVGNNSTMSLSWLQLETEEGQLQGRGPHQCAKDSEWCGKFRAWTDCCNPDYLCLPSAENKDGDLYCQPRECRKTGEWCAVYRTDYSVSLPCCDPSDECRGPILESGDGVCVSVPTTAVPTAAPTEAPRRPSSSPDRRRPFEPRGPRPHPEPRFPNRPRVRDGNRGPGRR